MILFVVTEQPAFLTSERVEHYQRLRGRLERIARAPVTSRCYVDVRDASEAEALVLSGSFAPWSAHDPGALDQLGATVSAYRGPVLGICAGMQLQALFAGGAVATAAERTETGYGTIEILDDTDLLRGLPARIDVYQHHSDEISALPASFRVLARSGGCAVEAIADRGRQWWGTQFHPEEFGSDHPAGERVLRNFFELAGPLAET